MKARDVMVSPVITAKPSASVNEVAKLLLERRISAVPVVDDQGEVVGGMPAGDLYLEVSIVRVAKAKRLERDLGLNLPGIALVLDLLDQLDEMRSHSRALQGAARPAEAER